MVGSKMREYCMTQSFKELNTTLIIEELKEIRESIDKLTGLNGCVAYNDGEFYRLIKKLKQLEESIE
jgi:hypothetical protein